MDKNSKMFLFYDFEKLASSFKVSVENLLLALNVALFEFYNDY